ncbi:hypothetical protein K488DRAFT_69731 [Vararia minispora EC-137]|uniref:Uncharacterized protein n=1 Tax=Vararia minispora EC-137 TaxID=1314806 RepID=A0ACB8QP39_9AGAM|nr:hypothetical protein K488DRAFT_69731 [Vararia minispora EC-137]
MHGFSVQEAKRLGLVSNGGRDEVVSAALELTGRVPQPHLFTTLDPKRFFLHARALHPIDTRVRSTVKHGHPPEFPDRRLKGYGADADGRHNHVEEQDGLHALAPGIKSVTKL